MGIEIAGNGKLRVTELDQAETFRMSSMPFASRSGVTPEFG